MDVKSSKRDIHNLSYSNRYIEKLLTRRQVSSRNIKDIQRQSFRKKIRVSSAIVEIENAETIDWLTQYIVIGDEWDSFRLFGFAIDDMKIFKQGLTLIFVFYATTEIKSMFQF